MLLGNPGLFMLLKLSFHHGKEKPVARACLPCVKSKNPDGRLIGRSGWGNSDLISSIKFWYILSLLFYLYSVGYDKATIGIV